VATGAKMMQLFNSMSSPSFLLANDTNHALLRSLLESMNSILEHQFNSELMSGLMLRGNASNNLQKIPSSWRQSCEIGNVSRPFATLP
jgi:hypothetical protein